MTGNAESSVRQHVRNKYFKNENAFLEERKLKAKHILREIRTFQKKARRKSLHLVTSGPKKLSKAMETRKEYKDSERTSHGDGLVRIHAQVKLPIQTNVYSRESSKLEKMIKSMNGTEKMVLSSLMNYEIFKVIDMAALVDLCKDSETVKLEAGEVLYRYGQELKDVPLYTVVKGAIALYTMEEEQQKVWHDVKSGRMVHGLMQVLATVLGSKGCACVEAKAKEDGCVLVKIPLRKIKNLRNILKDKPIELVRMIRMTLMRHNSVTLTTAIRYLGLIKQCRDTRQEENGMGEKVKIQTSEEKKKLAREMTVKVLGIAKSQMPEMVYEWNEVVSVESEPLVMEGENKIYLMDVAKNEAILPRNASPLLCIVLTGHAVVKIGLSQGPSDTFELYDGDDDGMKNILYEAKPGDTICHLSMISSTWNDWYGSRHGRQPVCVPMATQDSLVVYIPQTVYDLWIAQDPNVAINAAKRLIRCQSKLTKQLDIAMEWIHVNSGEIVATAGEETNCMHIVLNGRLRETVTVPTSNEEVVVGELAQGSTIGEAEILSKGKYRSTVRATRETQLCKVPAKLVQQVVRRYPEAMIHFAKAISYSLTERRGASQIHQSIHMKRKRAIDSLPVDSIAVAILPITGSVPVQLFARSLSKCISSICSVSLLTSEGVGSEFGVSFDGAFEGFDHFADVQGISWLNQMESQNAVVLYQCDWDASAWTRLCIRQADLVLLVANASDLPHFSSLEKQVQDECTNAKRELVLLHVNPSNDYRPENTRQWIEYRPVSHHHHVRVHTQNINIDSTSYKSDFSRLARWLTGTSVGIVLGGGGSRGLAHLGVLRALEEEGIPIDLIGGTSIGAFFGGLYAQNDSSLKIRRAASLFSKEMGSLWGYIKDFTLPLCSYFTGSSFNLNLFGVFKNTKIEDLWLSYFCVTTNLTRSRENIHQNGTIWRYIRASMSLCGYLPPLCDSSNDDSSATSYLCDGGYVNNLPADVMKEMLGAGIILAVDVGAAWDFAGEDYGDTLSGWTILMRKYNPFMKAMKVPSLADIQAQVLLCSSYANYHFS